MQDGDHCEDETRSLILVVSSCGDPGNTWTYDLVPSWTPCNGFHTCSLPEQSLEEQKSFVHVHIAVLLLQKLFMKTRIPWIAL